MYAQSEPPSVRGLTPNSNMQTDPCRSFLGDSGCTPYAPQTHPGSIPDPSGSSQILPDVFSRMFSSQTKIWKDPEWIRGASVVHEGCIRSPLEKICKDLCSILVLLGVNPLTNSRFLVEQDSGGGKELRRIVVETKQLLQTGFARTGLVSPSAAPTWCSCPYN